MAVVRGGVSSDGMSITSSCVCAAMAVGAGVVAEGVKRPAGVVKVINAGSGRGLAVLRLQQASTVYHHACVANSLQVGHAWNGHVVSIQDEAWIPSHSHISDHSGSL